MREPRFLHDASGAAQPTRASWTTKEARVGKAQERTS
jgi:hypothetical protein